VLNEQGLVYSFGKGSNGRLGIGKSEYQSNIVQESRSDDGDELFWPNLETPELVKSTIPGFKDITQIATRCRHAVVLSEQGHMYTWGFNYYDQLGVGVSDQDCDEPTKCKLPQSIKVA
jgi:alpha-tubulin suppressor-like RCC1 family protein